MSGISLLAALKAFDATARAGSITVAAKQLGLRQPTVSAHILRLESEYGVELFFRHGRRLVLTEFGHSLMEHTRRIFSAEEDAHSMLAAAKTHYGGTLNLHAIGPYNITPIIKSYQSAYPGVKITVTVGDSKSITQRILTYQGDLGMVLSEPTDPQIFCQPYREQKLVIFASSSHPLATKREVTLQDLVNQEFVMREEGSGTRQAFEDALKQQSIQIRTSVQMRSREAVREAVAQGLGLGVVADRAYLPGDNLVKLDVKGFDATTCIRLICRVERKNSPLIAQFLKTAQSTLQSTP